MHLSEPTELRIVAVLVAFDLERNPLLGIEAVLSAVDHLIVVDNTPKCHPALTELAEKPHLSIIKNRNIGGLAGAYNAGISRINTDYPSATHVLFLDDDTDTTKLKEFLNSELTQAVTFQPHIAAVAPTYVDRETGLRGTHIRLNTFSYEIVPRGITQPTCVSFLINSMSLWQLAAIKRIGPYSTQLKVDHVDTDYCLRAALNDFQLVLNPTVAFIHSIGKRRQYQFLGKTLQSGGHSPQRREMIARNTIVLGRHYLFIFPSFAALCVFRIIYEILGVTMVENNRIRKLFSIFKGILIGIVTRYA